MANIDNVQLPDGSSYNIVDNTSGFATQNYVDSAVSSVTKTTIGLGNVDNTSDLNKPISTATQAALDTLGEDKADKTDIATVESGTTASKDYRVGEQFYFNGQLVRATVSIASGATITLNGNCELSNKLTEQYLKAKIVSDYLNSNGNIETNMLASEYSVISAYYSGALVIPYIYDTGVNAKWGFAFFGATAGTKITGPSSFKYGARILYTERKNMIDY